MFIHSKNQSDFPVTHMVQQLGHLHGVELHAYADWSKGGLDLLSQYLARRGFEMHHIVSEQRLSGPEPVADHEYLVRAIRQALIRRPGISTFAFIGGDGCFLPIAEQLKWLGKEVFVDTDSYQASQELCATAGECPSTREWSRMVQRHSHDDRMN
jgi:hypothetical protein